MKRILLIVVCGLGFLLALAYVADYLVLRYRMSANRNAFGTVTLRSYYAVQEKNNRTEFVFKDSEDQTCVHSLFSHLDYAPCWYLRRHTEKQIII